MVKIKLKTLTATTIASALSLSAVVAQTAEGLFVHPVDGSAIQSTALDNIQRLTFDGNDLSVVENTNGTTAGYALDDVAKLTFGDIIVMNIDNPTAQSAIDVNVYVTPAGELVVESPVAVKSLVLFSMSGTQMLRTNSTSISLTSLQTGVYVLLVETNQGNISKKIIKK